MDKKEVSNMMEGPTRTHGPRGQDITPKKIQESL